MDRGWGLGVPEVVQGLSLRHSSTTVRECGGVLSFRDSGGNDGDLGAEAVDGRVEEGGVGGAQKVESASDTAGVGAGKVGAIGMDPEEHG